jgi:hypothetical protein
MLAGDKPGRGPCATITVQLWTYVFQLTDASILVSKFLQAAAGSTPIVGDISLAAFDPCLLFI